MKLTFYNPRLHPTRRHTTADLLLCVGGGKWVAAIPYNLLVPTQALRLAFANGPGNPYPSTPVPVDAALRKKCPPVAAFQDQGVGGSPPTLKLCTCSMARNGTALGNTEGQARITA